MLKFINKLAKVAPRYGKKEAIAAKIITDELKRMGISFKEESFKTIVPNTIKAELFVDGVSIPCIGSSLKGGNIKSGKYLISSLGYSGENHPFNIAYNPITDEISVVDFYNKPSVTVSRKYVAQIVMGKKVQGMVKVGKEKFLAKNILVGNTTNSRNVIIAHYDSIIGNGAIDNAGSVAVMLFLIKDNPKILQNSLFIFAGNEEISYDRYKTRSGFGFRAFEKNHEEVLVNAKQIIVLDGIGIGRPKFVQTGLDWVLQIRTLSKIKNKVYWLQNDQSEVLKYFHSKADTVDKLNENFLIKAKLEILKRLR